MAQLIGHLSEQSPQRIERQIEAEMWLESPWMPFIGEIVNKANQPVSGLASANIPNTPIVKYTGFDSDHTDTIYIPQRRRLTGTPIYGDQDIKGQEESLSWYLGQLYVNAISKSVETKIGEMNELRSKHLRQAEQARQGLVEWYSDILTQQTTKAFYEGFSPNVRAAAAVGGLAIAKRDHPLFMAYGSNALGVANQTADWIDWSATAATYEDRIAVALAAMDGVNIPDTAFGSRMLTKLRRDLIVRRIFPTARIGGKQCWVIFCHPDAFNQALLDENIARATMAAYQGMKEDNPYIAQGDLYYGNFIIKDNILIGQEVHQTGSTTVLYGPVNAAEDTELNQIANLESTQSADRDMKVSLVIGRHALSMGQVGNLKTKSYDKDVFKEALGATKIWGAARMDTVDNVGTPTAVSQFGSAVIATVSPSV